MTKKSQQGFSLIEMALYIAILSFMLVIIVSILVTMNKSIRQIKVVKSIENSGIFSMERIVREIRDAQNIVTASSTLSSTPGATDPNTLVVSATTGTSTRTVSFSVQGGLLHIKENGVDQGSLTQSDARVTSLTFFKITTPHSTAVRTKMTVESGTSTYYRTGTFYATTILRGSL